MVICRYSIVCPQTWPQWKGDQVSGVKTILASVNMDTNEYQLGTTKVFIKTPESVNYYVGDTLKERGGD